MSENFNSNSFAPFLETISRSASKSPTTPGPVTILQTLAAAPHMRMDVSSLLSTSELPIDLFASTLKDLETAGLIVTQVENGRQIAVLNPMGEQVARVGVK